MVVYAILSFFVATAGGGLILGLVGAFVFYNSSELYGAAKRGELGGHPIFGRECYQCGGGSGNGGNGDSGSRGVAQEEAGGIIPAQTDSAVLA